MQRDAELMHVPFDIDARTLERWLLSLVDANHAYDATLRVAVVRNKGGLFEAPDLRRDYEVIAFTADRARWPAGVHLSYFPNGRFSASPFAGVKVTSWAENLVLYEEAHRRGLDEFILLNEAGEVSECTSANLFAIVGHEISTPPLATSGCLPGVTRAVLLEEIQLPGVTIRERSLSPSELEMADLVFISSTTRDLLPVLTIDGAEIRREAAVFDRLASAFASYRNAYVSASSRSGMLVRA
jgi:branched-chain amino acid aminotransferase